MNVVRFLAMSFTLLAAAPGAAQRPSDADLERMVAEVQASHIGGNVPNEADFARLLERDLGAYFAATGIADARIDFELLRRGATQSGVAYPKFYLWVRVASGRDSELSGAVRVAAIEKERFEVTAFVSASEIAADPDALESIFPALLLEQIRGRAAQALSPTGRQGLPQGQVSACRRRW